MNKKDEALKLALEAMRFALHVGFDESSESQIKKGDKAVQQHQNAITAIREALAEQPAQRQEPVEYWTVADGWVAEQAEVPAAAWIYPEFWDHCKMVGCGTAYRLPGAGRQPLYTSPPAAPASQEEIQRLSALVRAQQITIEKLESQRQWVGLTDEEIWDEVKAADLDWQTGWSLDEDASNRYITFARAIEAAHGIKENNHE